MDKTLKLAAVAVAVALALVTGSLYVKSVRDDIRERQELNQRLKTLHDDVGSSSSYCNHRLDHLQKHCKGIQIARLHLEYRISVFH